MSVTISSDFTETNTDPFITSESKKYYNGIIAGSGSYYYTEPVGANKQLYIFQRAGDTSAASGSITINEPASVNYYLVGGGGGGGSAGGGGGGSYVSSSVTTNSGQILSITIGGGGNGVSTSPTGITAGTDGGVTTFNSTTANGGSYSVNTYSDAYRGNKFVDQLANTYFYGGGGGGGAGTSTYRVGGNGYLSLGGRSSGSGGGGGGGWENNGGNATSNPSTAGNGGTGGTGGTNGTGTNPQFGTANGAGGGGGGGTGNGGNGGPGGGGGGTGGSGGGAGSGGAGGGGGGGNASKSGGNGGVGGGGGGKSNPGTGSNTGGKGGVGLVVLVITFSAPCFKLGTKILTDNGYKRIEELRKGNLVKTLLNNYQPIVMIGKQDIYHTACQERIKDQLYKCSPNQYPELFEDLFITGGHSILVDDFLSDEQKNKTNKLFGKIYVTDNKYLLLACVDERASVYETPGKYTIYHLALENEDDCANYGIYANGLLVESCSKRFLKQISRMELIHF